MGQRKRECKLRHRLRRPRSGCAKPDKGMNDNEINIAIAKACGWIKFWQQTEEHEPIGHWEWHKGNVNLKACPNYCTDLNAMHEAEKTLTDEQKPLYVILMLKGGGESKGVTLGAWWCLHSIARQRAEAFLRTLGRWKE